jgi:hypothetical protein
LPNSLSLLLHNAAGGEDVEEHQRDRQVERKRLHLIDRMHSEKEKEWYAKFWQRVATTRLFSVSFNES